VTNSSEMEKFCSALTQPNMRHKRLGQISAKANSTEFGRILVKADLAEYCQILVTTGSVEVRKFCWDQLDRIWQNLGQGRLCQILVETDSIEFDQISVGPDVAKYDQMLVETDSAEFDQNCFTVDSPEYNQIYVIKVPKISFFSSP